MFRQPLIPLMMLAIATSSGCVPIEIPPDGGNGNGDTPEPTAPQVVFTVSNPNPQINEEVLLTCSVVAGEGAGTTFDFQPSNGRLFAGAVAGTAAFLVEASDIGVAFTYTCTATNEHGTSESSNAQTILPG